MKGEIKMFKKRHRNEKLMDMLYKNSRTAIIKSFIVLLFKRNEATKDDVVSFSKRGKRRYKKIFEDAVREWEEGKWQ